jgi:prolyl-tRNA synthetase
MSMRQSQLFTKTRREAPKDEVSKNAILLTRAGFIHKEIAGVYAYLPLGKRVIEKISKIIREEMNAIGGQEVSMTTLQPKEIFEKTDRWDDKKVDNWFKTKLANGTELGMGLTHEEPIVDAIGDYISSYKDLPILVYQIQTKFRNELRAKSGLLRGREFLMKDMYSFARTQEEHDQIYEKVAGAYNKIYTRLGIGDITYRTYADGGIFTERFSDEFQTLSEIGEDTIYLDESRRIAVNKEVYTDENLVKMGLKKGDLVEKKAIEVGNIFPLESKYTDALNVYYKDENGNSNSIIAGCYGIGVSRLMGAFAEIFSDEKGLVWPQEVAPFRVHLISLGQSSALANEVYQKLQAENIEVLYDDRDLRAGEKFADADLIGIPTRVVVGEKSLESKMVEVKERSSEEVQMMTVENLINEVTR